MRSALWHPFWHSLFALAGIGCGGSEKDDDDNLPEENDAGIIAADASEPQDTDASEPGDQCAAGLYGKNCADCTKGASYNAEECTFKDTRNGTVYPVYKINGKFWLGKNLDYVYGGEYDTHAPDNKTENVSTYGLLYNWETAKQACPSGWNLPEKEDFDDLVAFAGGEGGGKKLMAESAGGTDDYGFGALLAGEFYGSTWRGFGSRGRFWTVTEYNKEHVSSSITSQPDAYFLNVTPSATGVTNNTKGYGLSVRCMKK